jgi:hypothetical protein
MNLNQLHNYLIVKAYMTKVYNHGGVVNVTFWHNKMTNSFQNS